jgi:ABC-2 type transport system permease protein
MKNILTIIKKELRNYFNNPTAYVIILAFLFLWEFLFFRNVFLVGEASLRGLFDILPWILLVIVPALTMGTLAEEKSDGTLEFLLTHPLHQAQLVIGKFFSIVLFFALTLLFIFPLAWSLGKFGSLDWGQIFGQYTASIFAVSVLASLGIVISGLFSSQISAFLVTIIASFFLIISGTELVTARLPFELAPFFEQLSLSTHFNSMARGVIDLRDLWYFVSLSAVFLGLAYLGLVKNKYGNKKSAFRNIKIAVSLLVGIFVLSNIVGINIPGRLDLTQEKIYTLSETTRDIAGNLPDVVNISLYASDKLPAQLQPVLRETKDILADYQAFSKGNIRVSDKNPSGDSALAKEAASLGVMPMQFNVVSQEQFQVNEGYLGIAVSYGGKHESIPFVENINDLEYQLTSFLTELTAENKPKIGFVSGHGEKSLASDYTVLQKELAKQFEIVPVAAAGADPATSNKDTSTANKTKSAASTPTPVKSFSIPNDVKVLVIAGPTQDYSAEEKKAVTDFIANGGSVFFMIDGTTISPENMSVAVNEKSLADFVKAETGVEVGKDLVYDLKSNQAVGFGGAGQSRVILPYPFWVQASRDNNSLPIATKLENILLPWGSSLTVDASAVTGKGWEEEELFSSSAYAGTQSAQFNINPNQKFSQSGLAQKTLVLALSPKAGEQNQSRVIIVGSSNFISDQFLQNGQANLSFALDGFSWLGQGNSLGNIKIKNLDERKLVFESSGDQNLIKYGNLAFVFLTVSGYGTLRMWKRKKKKNDSYEA